jgi:hypothetical protein
MPQLSVAVTVTVVVVIVAVVTMTVLLTKIAVMIAIPAVVVFDVAAGTFPMAWVIILTVVARRHPGCSLIRRPGPVSVVPFVISSHRVPITLGKYVVGGRTYGAHLNYARRRRRADPYIYGDLPE